MQDGIIKGTGNSRFLKSVPDFLSQYPTYESFVAALAAGTLPVDFNGINETGWQQLGTALNKGNLLSDETAALFNLLTTANINDALRRAPGLVGDIRRSMRNDLDSTWALCNGTWINKNENPELFKILENKGDVLTSSWNSITVPLPTQYVGEFNGVYYGLGIPNGAVCYSKDLNFGWKTTPISFPDKLSLNPAGCAIVSDMFVVVGSKTASNGVYLAYTDDLSKESWKIKMVDSSFSPTGDVLVTLFAGAYFVFASDATNKSYVWRSKNLDGPWEKDLLFDGAQVTSVYASGNHIVVGGSYKLKAAKAGDLMFQDIHPSGITTMVTTDIAYINNIWVVTGRYYKYGDSNASKKSFVLYSSDPFGSWSSKDIAIRQSEINAGNTCFYNGIYYSAFADSNGTHLYKATDLGGPWTLERDFSASGSNPRIQRLTGLFALGPNVGSSFYYKLDENVWAKIPTISDSLTYHYIKVKEHLP